MAKQASVTPIQTPDEVIRLALTTPDAANLNLDILTADDARAGILAGILNATDEAGVDAAAGNLDALSTADVAGQTFTILPGVTFLRSAFDAEPGSPGIYATFRAVDADGQEVLIRSSSGTIMAQLFKYDRDLKCLPARKTVVRADHATAAGFYPMWLGDAS